LVAPALKEVEEELVDLVVVPLVTILVLVAGVVVLETELDVDVDVKVVTPDEDTTVVVEIEVEVEVALEEATDVVITTDVDVGGFASTEEQVDAAADWATRASAMLQPLGPKMQVVASDWIRAFVVGWHSQRTSPGAHLVTFATAASMQV
jgi:hypothetical protein